MVKNLIKEYVQLLMLENKDKIDELEKLFPKAIALTKQEEADVLKRNENPLDYYTTYSKLKTSKVPQRELEKVVVMHVLQKHGPDVNYDYISSQLPKVRRHIDNTSILYEFERGEEGIVDALIDAKLLDDPESDALRDPADKFW